MLGSASLTDKACPAAGRSASSSGKTDRPPACQPLQRVDASQRVPAITHRTSYLLLEEDQRTDMSQDVSTWIVAISNAILAIGAIVTSIFAIKAFLTQSQQLTDQRTINSLQAHEIEASLSQRKRAQAAEVFIELRHDPPPSWVTVNPAAFDPDALPWHYTAAVSNTSTRPIYDVKIHWTSGNASVGTPASVPRIMPGQSETFDCEIYLTSQPIDPDTASALLRFRDAAGITWQLTPDGILQDLPPSSTEEGQAEIPTQPSPPSGLQRAAANTPGE